ncbi:MAG: META domain-containing protein [Spirochaetales bacterium]|nr:META domain-containing protein [Spirochaetales bacterium]
MKKIIIAGAAAALFFFLWSCASQSALIPPGGLSFGGDGSSHSGGSSEADARENSQSANSSEEDNSKAANSTEEENWNLEEARKAAAGMYKGLMPYPGSEGLETVVRLRKDGTYLLRSRVLGKADDTVEVTGSFDINRKGIITLDKAAVNTLSPNYVLSAEPAAITQLDAQGKPVSGDAAGLYTLKRFPAEITETYWKLVSLYGKPVRWTGDIKREPHIILRLEGYKVFGHSGTNSFAGRYTVKPSGSISFSPMRASMIASPNMKIEMDLYQALNETNSYTLDEETFTIGIKGQPPSAVFQAVYLR